MTQQIISGSPKPETVEITAERQARLIQQAFSNAWNAVHDCLAQLSPDQRLDALTQATNQLRNWQFSAAPSAQRENALFLATSVLYLALGVLFYQRFKAD